MGLKTDSSFLRFVTMGAVGALSVAEHLRRLGFAPIELERYCTSNKIWQTKVKRIRLPDLLCVRTGLRFEVRGKSLLAVKMSHSEQNPDRAWDAGLRDNDLASFVLVRELDGGGFEAAHPPVTFTVADLRLSVGRAKLGPPKSASEGAERDLTWPTIVPKASGLVESVGEGKVKVYKPDEARPRYTYTLNGKIPYVREGDQFTADASILAGVVPGLADLSAAARQSWNLQEDLRSGDPGDRFSAVKAFPFVLDSKSPALSTLSEIANSDEPRIRLEAAGALAKLDQEQGFDNLDQALENADEWDDGTLGTDAVRMEAILILGEVGQSSDNIRVKETLLRVLDSEDYVGMEVRQAAAWSLGRAGVQDYRALVPFIDDADEDVALHALCAFSSDAPDPVISDLVEAVSSGTTRARASAAEILVRLSPQRVAQALVPVATDTGGPGSDWAIGVLGRLPLEGLDSTIPAELLPLLAPVRALHHDNWLAGVERIQEVAFLSSQTIGAAK